MRLKVALKTNDSRELWMNPNPSPCALKSTAKVTAVNALVSSQCFNVHALQTTVLFVDFVVRPWNIHTAMSLIIQN